MYHDLSSATGCFLATECLACLQAPNASRAANAEGMFSTNKWKHLLCSFLQKGVHDLGSARRLCWKAGAFRSSVNRERMSDV